MGIRKKKEAHSRSLLKKYVTKNGFKEPKKTKMFKRTKEVKKKSSWLLRPWRLGAGVGGNKRLRRGVSKFPCQEREGDRWGEPRIAYKEGKEGDFTSCPRKSEFGGTDAAKRKKPNFWELGRTNV